MYTFENEFTTQCGSTHNLTPAFSKVTVMVLQLSKTTRLLLRFAAGSISCVHYLVRFLEEHCTHSTQAAMRML